MDIEIVAQALIIGSIILFSLYSLEMLLLLSRRVKTLVVEDEGGILLGLVRKYRFFLDLRMVRMERWMDELLIEQYALVMTMSPEVVLHVTRFYHKTIVFFLASDRQDPESQYRATIKAHAVLREPIEEKEFRVLLARFFL